MGHSGLKTGLHERKFTEEVYIQHHGAVQPHIYSHPHIYQSSITPPHTAHTDCHRAWEKQPAKADSNLADFEIR